MIGINRRTEGTKKTFNCETGMKVTESKPKENEIDKNKQNMRDN